VLIDTRDHQTDALTLAGVERNFET